jgi:phosphatidate cytidylyltransferase
MNNFIQRALTGSLFVLGIVFLLQYGSDWGTHLLLASITAGCMYEYNQLIGLNSKWLQAASLLGVLLFVFADFTPRDQWSLMGGMSLLVLVVFSLQVISKENPLEHFARIFLGVAYIAFPMHSVHNLMYTDNLILGLFILVWTSDTGAYLSGKWLGKHKLLPSVSPGKTWEGLIGGTILTMAVALVLSNWTQAHGSHLVHFLNISPLKAVVWGLGVAVSGTLGDLFESRLKRIAGVKDSGSIFPGHGGFLDRFDAFLFAALFTKAIFQGPLAIF